MAKLEVRAATVKLLLQMQNGGGSLTRLIPDAQNQLPDNDRALLQVFCFGMARWSGQLSGLVDALLSKPLKQKDTDIYLLMQLGVFQLMHTRVAPHAAVDKTVAAVKQLGKPWAKGLVNAVLRNFQRQSDELLNNLDETARTSHPNWLLNHFKGDWPSQWESIVEHGNRQAPMTLRVNLRKHNTDQYLHELQSHSINGTRVNGLNQAITLEEPVPVQRLPGFDEGAVSVQDGAAQIAASLLDSDNKARLLDACAAPGGKTAHALELGDWHEVIALDQDKERLSRVDETLARLNLSARCKTLCADAVDTKRWWDGQLFDAILLDAPCSGTGVIRRHPDIKLLRRSNDIAQLVDTQRELLNALWPVLKPGGRLLYATCSILKCENEQQIQWFLEREDVKLVDIDLPVGSACDGGGIQILPGDQGLDGFFYALLEKPQ